MLRLPKSASTSGTQEQEEDDDEGEDWEDRGKEDDEVKAGVAVAATAVWQLLQGAELLGSVANIV